MIEGIINIIKKMLSILTLSTTAVAPINTENTNHIADVGKKELICIDPGHQIKGDPGLEEVAPGSLEKKPKVSSGAMGIATKKYEYQLVLEVGLKLRDALQSKGYKVFMVRETNNVNISNKERAIKTNEAGCSLYVRLHADGVDNSSVNGASVLTSSQKNRYTQSVQKSSDKFSHDVLSEYIKSTGAKNRGVSYRDDLTGTNWSKVTNTLIELGFMSNPAEDKKMSTSEYQNKMVLGIVNGIEKYLKEK